MKFPDYSSDHFGQHSPKRMPVHFFFEANRMNYETAQSADISRQNYSVCPRYWYVDATFNCADCGKEFTFSASEQRFWFEDMFFWVDSRPKRCVPCRKAERADVELRKRYDSMIGSALGKCPIETKQEVVAIIDELEASGRKIPDRMKENRSQLCAQLSKQHE